MTFKYNFKAGDRVRAVQEYALKESRGEEGFVTEVGEPHRDEYTYYVQWDGQLYDLGYQEFAEGGIVYCVPVDYDWERHQRNEKLRALIREMEALIDEED